MHCPSVSCPALRYLLLCHCEPNAYFIFACFAAVAVDDYCPCPLSLSVSRDFLALPLLGMIEEERAVQEGV